MDHELFDIQETIAILTNMLYEYDSEDEDMFLDTLSQIKHLQEIRKQILGKIEEDTQSTQSNLSNTQNAEVAQAF